MTFFFPRGNVFLPSRSVCPLINQTCFGIKGYFVCQKSGRCISKQRVCDCVSDCPKDGSDEKACGNPSSNASRTAMESFEQAKNFRNVTFHDSTAIFDFILNIISVADQSSSPNSDRGWLAAQLKHVIQALSKLYKRAVNPLEECTETVIARCESFTEGQGD